MRSVAIVLFGFGLLATHAAVATLAPMHTFAPNLVLPIAICLGVSADVHVVRGAVISFVLGYALDAFCGNPMGLQTFVLVASFMLARGVAFRLLPQGAFMSAVLTFAMALLSGFGVLALRAIFEQQREILSYEPLRTASILLGSALTTALFAPAIFAAVRRVDGRLLQKTDERATMA